MKNTILFISFMLSLHLLPAQNNPEVTEKFKVYGNCGMCKSTIENAVNSLEGITSVKWNVDIQKLTVTYDQNISSLKAIKMKIAEVGYDTDDYRADDETYNSLHHCCKYKRPKKKKNS